MTTKTVLFGTAAVLAFSAADASAAAPHPTAASKRLPSHFILLSHLCCKGIYAQRDNDNGIGIVSQNFTDPIAGSFDIYDSQGADDFPIVRHAKVKEVDADGVYFNGSGPADSYNVTFYTDAGGTPGTIVKACNNASYTDLGFGTPSIKCKAKLGKGSYWVSVQANMAFSAGGEWGWNTNNTVRHNASQWQNPGNGFSTGCTTYTTTTTCIPAGEGGDFSFELRGKGH